MNLSLFLQLIQKLINIFISKDAPEQSATGITTSSQPQNTETIVRIVRNHQTFDATMGVLTLEKDGSSVFNCVTLERTAVMIPEGTYTTQLEMSPHFGFETPHLQVPGRTYIEQHPGNVPNQTEGCQLIGSSVDGDAIDSSDSAFVSYIKLLPPTRSFVVVVTSSLV